MNSVTFTEGFRFLQFTFERSHYYDHRNKGCNRHFLAYMVSGYGKLVGQDPSVTIELSPGDVFYIGVLSSQVQHFTPKDLIRREPAQTFAGS